MTVEDTEQERNHKREDVRDKAQAGECQYVGESKERKPSRARGRKQQGLYPTGERNARKRRRDVRGEG